MASKWPQKQLEEISELSGGFAFKSEDYSTAGRFVLRTLNIEEDGSIHREDAVFLPLEKCDIYKRFELQEHDTLFVMVGATLGKVGYVRREALPALLNQNMWRIRGRDGLCDKRFLQYAFRHTVVKSLGWASGSARDFVRRDDYRSMAIPVPPLDEQKAIAEVLGALDDKIELNRRMNATLEAMARALFQSWFVDFDPVRAKLDGHTPAALDPAIAAHFPSHFDHKAEFLVPTGWNRKRWGDIATLEYGKSIRDYRDSGGKYRVFGTNGPIGFHDEALCKSAGIVIGRKGAYRGVHYSHEPFFVIDTAFYLKPKTALDLMWAYYELLRFDINSMDSGSAIPSTSRDDFYGIPVIVPPPLIQSAFGKIVGGWAMQAIANDNQSRTLATLRDTLLPKLLNGEIIVALSGINHFA